MRKTILALCYVVGLALTVGAQASIAGHSARPGDSTAGLAARIQQIEDLEASLGRRAEEMSCWS